MPFCIDGHHRITDGIERNCELFLADLRGDMACCSCLFVSS